MPSPAAKVALELVPRPLVLSLTEIDDAHRGLVGEKAANLAGLVRAGFPVPAAYVLTTHACEAFLAASGLANDVRRLEERLRSHPPKAEELEARLAEVRRRIIEAELPPKVRRDLHAAAERLGATDGPGAPAGATYTPLAVRSSALGEDLQGASFAGQYETILDVRGAAALEQAVKKCWASLWQPHVVAYWRTRTGARLDLGMGVVVQRLVAADASGVVFTINPLTGREREVLVEGVVGLGERYVAGRSRAERFVVQAHDGRILSSTTTATEGPLAPPAIARVAETALAVQEAFGFPVDMEWAVVGGTPVVLQARPITQLAFAPDFGSWTTANFKDGGVASDTCAPLMASLYCGVFAQATVDFAVDLRLATREELASTPFVAIFFGRPYWNVGLAKKLLGHLPGYNERTFDLDHGIASPGASASFQPTLRGLHRSVAGFLAAQRDCGRALGRVRELIAGYPARSAPFDLSRAALAALDARTFHERYRELLCDFYPTHELSYFRSFFGLSLVRQEFRIFFELANRAAGGTLDYFKLVGGLQNLSHLRPLKDLQALVARHRRSGRPIDDEAIRLFAERWKHQGRKLLDPRVPRWDEDLPFVRAMIDQALRASDERQDPLAQEEQRHAEYVAERRRAVQAIGANLVLRALFLRALERIRTLSWWREEMRDRSNYGYWLLRVWSLEAGRRLVEAGALAECDDVWYLEHRDVIDALSGALAPAEARRRAAAGRRLVRSFRAFRNPPEIRAASEPARAPHPADGEVLTGMAASPGRVTGRARVLRSLDELAQLKQGEILVAPFADPGWIPIYGRVVAIVTETGGVLSHTAVLAREYGLPTVVAVTDASTIIRTGDELTVDGWAGTVVRRSGRGRRSETPLDPGGGEERRAGEVEPGEREHRDEDRAQARPEDVEHEQESAEDAVEPVDHEEERRAGA